MKYLPMFCFLLIVGCQETNPDTNNASDNQEITSKEVPRQMQSNPTPATNNINARIEGNTFRKTLIAGNVKFEVSSENNDSSVIHVQSEGLSVREYDQKIPVEGHLINAFSLDLNHDDFYEIYLVVSAVDGSGRLEILGIASFNDKSAGEIHVKDIQVKRQPQTEKVYVHYGNLTRQFNDEANQVQVYQYRLTKGEAGFILEPVRTQ